MGGFRDKGIWPPKTSEVALCLLNYTIAAANGESVNPLSAEY